MLLLIRQFDCHLDLPFGFARLNPGIGEESLIPPTEVITLIRIPAVEIHALGAHPFDQGAVA